MNPRIAAGLLMAMVLLALTPRPAAACLCGGTSLDPTALEAADVAFVGVVTRVEDTNPMAPFTYSTADTIRYTFAVEEVLKGSPGESVIISSYRDGSSCGLVMANGERWRIFAHHQDLFTNQTPDELWVWLCDANERLAAGVPVPPTSTTDRPIVVLALAGALLIAIGISVGRLRARRRRSSGSA